ncbi:hypothetical protein IWW50_000613, partial [Coemansia erecta]
DELKGRQQQLEQVLLEIATIPSSTQARTQKRTWLRSAAATDSVAELLGAVPKPSRVTRDLVASVLALTYEFGQMHNMGDVLYAIQASMQSRAGGVSRIAAMTCAGVLFERLGQSAGFRLLSCFNDFVGIGVRAAGGSNEAEKADAMRMLARLIAGGSKVLGEQQAKDIMRVARANLAHRAPQVVMAACAVVQALARVPGQCDAADAVCSQIIALLGMRVLVVRRALARTVAVVVANTVVLAAGGNGAAAATRDVSVRESLDTSHGPRASTASAQVQATVAHISSDVPADTAQTPPVTAMPSPQVSADRRWTLARALQRLALPFTRGSRDQRLGIADTYAMLFEELGAVVVEQQYEELVAHIIGLAMDVPMGAERRAVCGMCADILSAARRVLLADGQAASAAHVLLERWLRTDALRSNDVAVLVLAEFSLMVEATNVDLKADVPVERWLVHDTECVRVAAASCVRACARRDPACVPRLLSTLVSRLQHASAQSATAQGTESAGACLGYATGVAAVLGAAASADSGLMGVPLDAVEWVHGIAVRLLHAAYERRDAAVVGLHSADDGDSADPAGVLPVIGAAGPSRVLVRRGNEPRAQEPNHSLALQNVQMQCGWMLLAGVAAVLGTSVSSVRQAQWQQLWAWAMPATFITGVTPWMERKHLLQSRALALAHMCVCLRARALTLSVSHLATLLRSTLLFADNALDAPTGSRDGAAQLVELHLLVRARALECLVLLDPRELAACSSIVQPALRLAENAMAGRDCLPDVFAAQMARAVVASEAAHPASPKSTTGSKLGVWVYEADVGVTSLLAPSVGKTDESDGMLRELDWAQIVLGDAPGAVAATRVVDAGVKVMGRVFPHLGETQQLAILDALVTRLNLLAFNGHRHMAVLTNMIVMAYTAVSAAQTGVVAMRVARAVVETARAALLVPEPKVRQLAGQVIGRLAAVTRDASQAYMPYLLDQLSGLAIRSRDRFARAGAAIALGALYTCAGSIAAGAGSLKQVVAMLHSLASDRDPVVHTWALGALAEAAAAAGYMFEPYARATLLMCQQLMLSDAHTAPFAASALWARGREHADAGIWDCASIERSQVRVAAGKVAVGWECAVVHPNSSAYHGRAPEEVREQSDHGGGLYSFVCTPSDVDSVDARAALGRLIGSLLLVLGPELQVDTEARTRVDLLLAELRRVLPSVICEFAAGTSVDPDARWESVAELIHATQRQLLFCFPADPTFVPLFVRDVLRPCLRVRSIMYHGYVDMVGLCSLQRVAVRALESVLRLYGDRVSESIGETESVLMLCDVVWESLWLHSSIDLMADHDGLATEVQRLVRTAVGSSVASALGRTPALAMVETLCAAFTKRASSCVPELQSIQRPNMVDGSVVVDDAAQQFGVLTKQLVVSALLAILDEVEHRRPGAPENGWRAHPLLLLLPDLLRVAHAASASEEDPDLCILGLQLVQRVVEQFTDVEDPAMRGECVLSVYQAQVSSSFMSKLGSDGCAVRVRVAAIGVAASYVVSGLVVDRGSMVRVLRLLAPQPMFDALPFAHGGNNGYSRSRSRSVTSADESMEVETPQLHVVVRLAILDAWSVVANYARLHSAVLRDVVDVHLPLLTRMWLGAVRDAAVISNQSTADRDVFGELDSLHDGEAGAEDVGLGLVLGLEAAYVPMVRSELLAWYRHYLPRIIRSVSRLLSDSKRGSGSVAEYLQRSEKMQLHGQASGLPQPPRLAMLVLCFAMQELKRVSSVGAELDTSDPFVQAVRSRLINNVDTGDVDSRAPDNASESVVSELIDTLRVLVSVDAYHLESAFVATASQQKVSWLVEELWAQAVSIPLRVNAGSGKPLEFGIALLDKLHGAELLDQWLFTDNCNDTDVDQWLQSLAPFGRTVVSDAVRVWERVRSSDASMTAQTLRILARVLGRARSDECALLWISLWAQSLGSASGCALQAAESLAAFASMSSRSTELANSVLAQMLQQADNRVAAVSIIAQLLARPDLGLTVLATVRALFASVFIACLLDVAQMPDAELVALLDVPRVLASSESASSVLTSLARKAIPQLAKLLYDASAIHIFGNLLTSLVHFASAAKYSKDGSVVMASILMLLLSMVDTQSDQVLVAEAILSLATVDPVIFKSIVVRLSSAHPQAKQRLESAVRSRAAHTNEASIKTAVLAAEEREATGIVLKSDFSI